ncbi:hypothetical protein SAMN05660330_04071 [Desulforhopalus singaporensis]|uniref:Uncharacterized protein n=1 Tax=Desulforhopalus singaporensis TaxID=91360 RepID=A0A1H0VIA0_9BACT|nr:hypothetical protein SAMN05660330_04071 [Desulforhopalus singaporensis]
MKCPLFRTDLNMAIAGTKSRLPVISRSSYRPVNCLFLISLPYHLVKPFPTKIDYELNPKKSKSYVGRIYCKNAWKDMLPRSTGQEIGVSHEAHRSVAVGFVLVEIYF